MLRASACVVGLFTVLSANRSDAQMVYSLQLIPAGTIVVDPKADHWNELVLLARPTLTSGDLDRLPLGLQQAVTRYAYTVLATITKAPPLAAEDPPKSVYRLEEVGVGYSASIDGVQVIAHDVCSPPITSLSSFRFAAMWLSAAASRLCAPPALDFTVPTGISSCAAICSRSCVIPSGWGPPLRLLAHSWRREDRWRRSLTAPGRPLGLFERSWRRN